MSFNKSQQAAILHKDGPMLVLAGPGSGKTTVITHRTKNLIENCGVNPSEILVITFTKAAAEEMKQRFLSLTKQTQTRVTFGTFHAVFFAILKHAYRYKSDNIVSEEQRFAFMKEILTKLRLDYKDENEFISDMLAEIGIVKNTQVDWKEYKTTLCKQEEFQHVYKEYQRKLEGNHLLDFDDMLTYTYELFVARKDILAAWQQKFKYILIDEFQDINQIQYEIVKMLAEPFRNLFIVGDDDQSIYRFRGSKPEIMLNFEKDYPNAQRVLLSYNYRCDHNITEAARNLISHNKERFFKDIRASREAKEPVRFLRFERQWDQNLFVLKDIADYLKNGGDYKNVAILFRTNTQPRLMMEQLMQYSVPFKTRDKIPNLYEHWIAKDLFSYLRIAYGSRNRSDFLNIMNKPKRYLSRDYLWDEQVDFVEWMKLYEEQPWIEERIEKLWYDIKMLHKMSPYAAINYIRHGIGYEEYVVEYANYRNLKQEDLFDVLDEIQVSAKGFKTLEEWEQHIENYSNKLRILAQKRNQNPNAITLATLHSAKGLEFENVYILDVNEGVIPYKKAVLDQELEEERRLFYVGMTRAKNKLSICSVKSVRDKTVTISRFVNEAQGINP